MQIGGICRTLVQKVRRRTYLTKGHTLATHRQQQSTKYKVQREMTGTKQQESIKPSPMPAASTTTDVDLLASQKRERVKARWGMLRQALLGSTQNNNNKHSMNSFSGFHVLDRTIIQGDDVHPGSDLNDECNVDNVGSREERESSSQQWDFVQNVYTSNKDEKKIQF